MSEQNKPEEREMVTGMEAPIYLQYNFTAGRAATGFLTQLKKGRLVGQRCPNGHVYLPPRGSCARCGVPTVEDVELSDKATVESFTIVHIPIPGNPIKPPFVVANLIPDGASISFIHLISGCANEDVRIGMRVQARWRDASTWDYKMENIEYFEPLDEPDVPPERLATDFTRGEGE